MAKEVILINLTLNKFYAISGKNVMEYAITVAKKIIIGMSEY